MPKKLLLGVLIIFSFLILIGLLNKPSEQELEAKRQANVEHCKQNNKVYIQKDPCDRGECMDFQEATNAAIKMQKDLDNRGLNRTYANYY